MYKINENDTSPVDETQNVLSNSSSQTPFETIYLNQ